MSDTRRAQLVEIVKREFIGPDPIDYPGMRQENGEEILSSDNPLIRYSAGILFPQHLPTEYEELDDAEMLKNNEMNFEEDKKGNSDARFNPREFLEEAEELINLSNSFKQSAISVTCAICHGDSISVQVQAGRYKQEKIAERKVYKRVPMLWNNDEKPLVLPGKNVMPAQYFTSNKDLCFWITHRYTVGDGSYSIYTFTLTNEAKITNELPKESDCFFQVEFRITSEQGFAPLPDNSNLDIDDEDYQSNRLLYRNEKNYAIGHGCSVEWVSDTQTGKATEIKSAIIPSYEMKPILPVKFNDLELTMYEMSDFGNFEETRQRLHSLCRKYAQWIAQTEKAAEKLPSEYQKTAGRHIELCRVCHNRMVNGVDLLENQDDIRNAFLYMNRAMLLQQLHYRLPLRNWETDKSNKIFLGGKNVTLPDIHDNSTWYGSAEEYGKWRPFQLAFILINLESMNDQYCDERKNVELIWFPTGGGKTEAYLGLSAFTIFLRKLRNKNDNGTAIIMRYTLRLLTAQQYDRASSMICACELIRKEKEDALGKNRISTGLWVGVGTTPNKMNDAVGKFDDLYQGYPVNNPFSVLKCPWCGAQMGITNLKPPDRVKGYKKTASGLQKKIIFQCDNELCDFSSENYPLPLTVIDEEIYENPPSLLIGTVDKFAMLPYRPEAQSLFGIYDGEKQTPPDLIIQDELHLISGPLGSMVGHYETMIDALCERHTDKGIIKPKIIASTATISRAKEQCHALYNCDKECVIQFPPPGIDAGESFFAYTDNNADGRLYVGVFAPGSPSHTTTSIRLYATLLYAAKALSVNEEKERDPYWTNIGYYNSLRELGQAATWVNVDVNEYLKIIYKRRYEDILPDYKTKRRYTYWYKELTSRIRSDNISESLQNLSVKYPPESERGACPVDICLATNMISVGIDIPRLGLMTVVGQPKTSSEYIQASSRVGRQAGAPGIIFVLYGPGKPRDRSHYEHFKSYHSKIYSHVEPTSVTPFSAPLRERALHAIVLGMIRLFRNKNSYIDPPEEPSEQEMKKVSEYIKLRVNSIDESESANTLEHIKEIIKTWYNEAPQKWHDFNFGNIAPLMYPAGNKPNINWEGRGFKTPTSMRSVDSPCEVSPLLNKYI